MLTNRQLFLLHLGQTSMAPMMLEIVRAEGIYMYGPDGKKYIDLISGVSVSNTGHSHPKVVEAVRNQAGLYMHPVSYTHLRAHETDSYLVCRLLLEKKKNKHT